MAELISVAEKSRPKERVIRLFDLALARQKPAPVEIQKRCPVATRVKAIRFNEKFPEYATASLLLPPH